MGKKRKTGGISKDLDWVKVDVGTRFSMADMSGFFSLEVTRLMRLPPWWFADQEQMCNI